MALIEIYLVDHLAGAVAAGELVRRAASSNRGNAYGKALARVAEEIEEDRNALRDVMRELDISPDRVKLAAAWLGEKAGRLKLNGTWISYSPLSRLVELEVLILGVEGKLLMWEALADAQAIRERVSAVDLDELAGRARAQLRVLRRLRRRAAREALLA